jgi:hypothetical protein
LDEELQTVNNEVNFKGANFKQKSIRSGSIIKRLFLFFQIKNSWFNVFEASLLFFFVMISVFFDSIYGSFLFKISIFIWMPIFYIIYSIFFSFTLKEIPMHKLLLLTVFTLFLDMCLFYFAYVFGAFPFSGIDIKFGPLMVISSLLLPLSIVLLHNSSLHNKDIASDNEGFVDTDKENGSKVGKVTQQDRLSNSLDILEPEKFGQSQKEGFIDIELPLSISGLSHYADNLVGSCGYILIAKDGYILSERNFFENSQVKALILDSLSKMIKDSLLRLDFGKLENMILVDDQIGVIAFLLRDEAKFFVFFDSRLEKKAQFELFSKAQSLASRLVFDII